MFPLILIVPVLRNDKNSKFLNQFFAKITQILQMARVLGDIFPFLPLCGIVRLAVIDIFLYFRVVYKKLFKIISPSFL